MRGLIIVSSCLALVAINSVSSLGKVGFRQVTSTHPVAVQRGTTAEVKLRSNFTLDETYRTFVVPTGIQFKFLETEPIAAERRGRTSTGAPFRFEVNVPADQLPGLYEYRVATRQAVSSVAQLMVTDYPVVLEDPQAENGTPATAQAVSFPVAVCGICEQFEDVDCYQIEAEAGQELTFEIFAQRVTDKIHSMVVRGPRIYLMDPILTLRGPQGQVLAQNDNTFGGDSFLHAQLPQAGKYTLEVRDARYAGDGRYSYCVEISDRPYLQAVHPLALELGTTAEVELIGHQLGETAHASITAGSETPQARRIRLQTSRGETNPVLVLERPYRQLVETEGNNSRETSNPVQLPIGINGRLAESDDIDFYKFTAAKGEMLHFEVESHRHGLPLDSVLEIYDDAGKLLAEADDRPEIRTKDARMFWTAPADGTYHLAIRDMHARGGPRFVYHLVAQLAAPDFDLFGEYYYAMLAPGTNTVWFARVQRTGGFSGPIAIEVDGLPPGVTQTPVTIPTGMDHCAIILSAAEDAQIDASLVRVRGRAQLDSSSDDADANAASPEIVRYGRVFCEQQSSGGGQQRWPIDTQLVGVTRPLDLLRVRATPHEVTLEPGKPVEIQVEIERAEGFTDAVTLAADFTYFTQKLGLQLPPGVTVSKKSKTRLTGKTLSGLLVLEASDKAIAVERLPITALARVSITFSITTNFASNPVYLTVKPAK